MTLTLALLGPVLGLLGLFVGGWLTRNHELEKVRRDRIIAAYAKLLDAGALGAGPRGARLTAMRGAGQTLNPDDEKFLDDIQAKFANAHSNITIYGSKEVIAALSRFYDCAPQGLTPETRDAYVALIKAMRHESEAEDFDAFEAHVDNILVTGPLRRAGAMAAPQPTNLNLGFSIPPAEDGQDR